MTPAGSDPLLGLFHADVTGHALTLSAGLAADPTTAAQFDALDAAIRPIKAASLLVGLAGAVDLARGLEAAVAAGRALGFLPPDRRTAATAAVERLVEFANTAMTDEPVYPTAEQIESLLVRLRDPITSRAAISQDPVRTVPAEPVSSPPPTPGDPHAATLLELFREEVRTLHETLSTGLVALESDAADPKKIEPLMRAAHSIKGAARIVSCEPAVDVAHVMEELLVAAQRGKKVLGPGDIDALLAGVDLLGQLADADLGTWAAENSTKASAVVDGLKAAFAGSPVPRPAASPSPLPLNTAPAPPPVPVDTAPQRTEPSANEPKDRVVRVGAQSLNRLLSLAGESLVEARWLQPFARSLLKLKKYQDHLADVIEDAARVTKTGGGNERVARLADDARRRLGECRQILAERIDEFETHARRSDDLNSRLYREVISSRMRPFADGTHGLARMVRDVARQLGKKARVEVAGESTDVDRDILDKLDAPLGHILRNAVDHGIEAPADRLAAGKSEIGTIRVEARHHAGVLNITIADDGRGINLEQLRRKIVDKKLTSAEMAARLSDPELLDFLFLPGFSTAEQVTDVSGRGVGLDVVQATAQAVGGSIRLSTRLGHGTTFELQLPITLSVVRAVLVRVAGDPYAVPLNRIDRLLRLSADDIRTLEGKPHFETDGRQIGLVPAHLVFDLPTPETGPAELSVVLIGDRTHQYGLSVEAFLGEQDLVVRPLDTRLGKVPNVAAAGVLEDGSPVLIVDVDDLLRSAGMLVHEGRLRNQRPARPAAKRKKRVLVVDDSAIVREVERQMLHGRGYEVDIAVDGVDGWNTARAGDYDLIVSDIDMPRMTGLEFVKAVRADPKIQSTPVVIVSYKDRDDDRARGLEAGANYYLTKSSFHDGRFLATVADLIGSPDE